MAKDDGYCPRVRVYQKDTVNPKGVLATVQKLTGRDRKTKEKELRALKAQIHFKTQKALDHGMAVSLEYCLWTEPTCNRDHMQYSSEPAMPWSRSFCVLN